MLLAVLPTSAALVLIKPQRCFWIVWLPVAALGAANMLFTHFRSGIVAMAVVALFAPPVIARVRERRGVGRTLLVAAIKLAVMAVVSLLLLPVPATRLEDSIDLDNSRVLAFAISSQPWPLNPLAILFGKLAAIFPT